jgi:hypothetical protein
MDNWLIDGSKMVICTLFLSISYNHPIIFEILSSHYFSMPMIYFIIALIYFFIAILGIAIGWLLAYVIKQIIIKLKNI